MDMIRQFQKVERLIREANRAGRRITTHELAEECEVSSRTMVRYLNELRDEHHAPIRFDQSVKTWRMDAHWTFRPMQLTEVELLQLALAAQLTRDYEGTPLAASLDSLFQKLGELSDDPVTITTDLTEDCVSFFHQPSATFNEDHWELLLTAIRQGRRVRMSYRAGGYATGKEYTLDPLHLSCREKDWYLVAQREDRDEPYLYLLSRIQKLKILPTASAPRAFDPQAYFRGSTGRWVPVGAKPVTVTLHFAPAAVEQLTNRTWHKDQKLKRNPDGSCTLRRPFGSLLEARSWVLQWGSTCEVKSPKSLREDVAQELRQMSALYG